jgi:aryl-alcohol dehydrogenase-like predicted oxidoreductase
MNAGCTSAESCIGASLLARVVHRGHEAAVARQRGATAVQVALAWLLAKNDGKTVIVPIPGTQRPKYVVENGGAADVRLSGDDVRWLESVFARDAVAGDRYPPVEASRAGT